MDYKELLKKMIKPGEFSFLSSITNKGYPQTRAMLAPIKIEDNRIYLHTNTSSNKVKQFKENSKSCLYFYDGSLFEGLTLIGDVKLLNDTDKMELWKDEFEFYYQEGIEDFTVIEFTISNGEYYSNLKTTEFKI